VIEERSYEMHQGVAALGLPPLGTVSEARLRPPKQGGHNPSGASAGKLGPRRRHFSSLLALITG
jgi:hypothetical protein